LEKFKGMKAGEILALTGQVHDEDFKYDRVLIMYVGAASYTSQLLLDDDKTKIIMPTVAATLGLNIKEKRVVDVAVHPYFRKFGFGKAIVNLAVKEYGVEVAYTVDMEAEKFWRRIGWMYVGKTIDKGTEVKMWMSREAVDEDMLSGLPEVLRKQFDVQEDEE